MRTNQLTRIDRLIRQIEDAAHGSINKRVTASYSHEPIALDDAESDEELELLETILAMDESVPKYEREESRNQNAS